MTQEIFSDAYVRGLRSTIRLLRSKGLFVQDAEELAQSAWVRGWEARHQLRDPNRVVEWVNTIALHKMFSEKRRASKFETLHDDILYSDGTPDARMDAAKLLSFCSRLDRELMLHCYGKGLNAKEIANIYGMSPAGVRVRIHRAKAAIRQVFEQTPLQKMAA